MIRVTNNLKEDLKGIFGGTDYNFPVGEGVVIEDNVAEFLFGLGQENKFPAFNRLGLTIGPQGMKEAMKQLQAIQFDPVEVDYVSADERPLVNGGVGDAGEQSPAEPIDDKD